MAVTMVTLIDMKSLFYVTKLSIRSGIKAGIFRLGSFRLGNAEWLSGAGIPDDNG